MITPDTHGLEYLSNVYRTYSTNPIIGYTNINSLRNKIIDLRHVISANKLDIISVAETKLSDDFSDAQLTIDGFYDPAQFRRDRTCFGGGLVVYVRNGIPAKLVKALEPSNNEVICVKVTLSKRKWLIYSFYRSESFTDLATFLKELN